MYVIIKVVRRKGLENLMNILLIDVEGTPNKLIYDIGLVVAKLEEDGTFTIQEKHQYLITEVFDNRELFDTAYYHKKRPKYYGLIRSATRQGIELKMQLKVALANIRKLKTKYNITQVVAYNTDYDISAFEKTCNYYHKANPIAELEPICIYALSGKYIHPTEDYKKWCKDNELISPAGYYSTNAENTFRYILGDIDFIEDHTGLKDVLIELDILNYILLNGGEFKMEKKTFHKSDRIQKLVIITNGKRYTFNYKQKYTKGNTITIKS
jgi:hypothetical protein